jgi:hypothetical protein
MEDIRRLDVGLGRRKLPQHLDQGVGKGVEIHVELAV